VGDLKWELGDGGVRLEVRMLRDRWGRTTVCEATQILPFVPRSARVQDLKYQGGENHSGGDAGRCKRNQIRDSS